MKFTADDLKTYFKNVIDRVEEEKDYLSELDRKLGDGDHGVTMSIGWQAVNEKLNGELKDEHDSGKICVMVGRTFLSAVGSSVGPLYATGFMRGGKVVQKKSELSEDDLVEFWVAFADGIKERGKAEVGDKTMVDTLEPAIETLKNRYSDSRNFVHSFTEAVSAGKKGMESTKDMISNKGRSSRLGNRSIGNLDPGAVSAYMILSTFLSSVESK